MYDGLTDFSQRKTIWTAEHGVHGVPATRHQEFEYSVANEEMRIFLFLLAVAVVRGESADTFPVCRKRVYCNSELLHRVQINRVCEYSKAFVDLHMNYDENKTLDDFEKLLNSHNNYLSKDQLKEFVGKYFSEDNGLEKWTPPDFDGNPKFLNAIEDKKLKEFARNIHKLWTHLGKKVKVDVFKNPDRYSLIPVSHGFFIPGDIELIESFTNQTDILKGIWSAVESGWDFSSRWFADPEETERENPRIDIRTMFISPVDLNAIIASALQHMANFHTDLMNVDKANTYAQLAQQLRDTIESVFWNEEDGVWYDYDLNLQSQRKYFYLSNFSPLWLSAVRSDFVKAKGEKILNYLIDSGALEYPGGVPISMVNSGEQWDFPNTSPPFISVLVNALESIGTEKAKELALQIAEKYVRASHVSFINYGNLCEKYDVNEFGKCGEGGERPTQIGFGWSIGVVLEFLMKYKKMTVAPLDDQLTTTISQYSESPNNSVGIRFGVINYIIIFVTTLKSFLL
ncbi:hypothetical protein HW555_012511 [Spodoptera exigua]|uniref:Trehalase n=1 Tax=Spodoptera exigua TaxID=7107 RepID=A0A835G5R4_SPOEX|nr:hypothetical protein HW555_012511 [Spodoptera exigua]